jgi:hypothetical protein
MTAAVPCEPGSRSVYPEQGYCRDADFGYYVPLAGTVNQTIAPIGKFANTTGLTMAYLCLPGYYANVTGLSACTITPAGYYTASTGLTIISVCTTGMYSNPDGQTACVNCAIGSFAPVTGMTACRLSPAGTYVNYTRQSFYHTCPLGIVARTFAVFVLLLFVCLDITCHDLCPCACLSPLPRMISNSPFSLSLSLSLSLHTHSHTHTLTHSHTHSHTYTHDWIVAHVCLNEFPPCPSFPHPSLPCLCVCVCLSGQYTNVAGMTYCLGAPAGKYVNAIGASISKNCPAGSYNSIGLQSACVDCALGWTSVPGATVRRRARARARPYCSVSTHPIVIACHPCVALQCPHTVSFCRWFSVFVVVVVDSDAGSVFV